MILMRHLLMDAQAKILSMMEDNKLLALRIDGAVQSASQEMTNLRAELTATNRRLAELSGGGGGGPGPGPGAAASASAAAADSAAANMENHQHSAQVTLQGVGTTNPVSEMRRAFPVSCVLATDLSCFHH
ncbi:kazrin-like isoform 1-T1 [Megaptera novaeangliae]